MIVQKVAQDQTTDILSLDQAKTFMRIVDAEDDIDIQSFIDSAIKEAEEITNRDFANATYELYLSSLPSENFKFPKNPVNEIVSIEYMDLNGIYQTIDPTTYYLSNIYEIGHVLFQEYPTVNIKNDRKAVRMTFKSGYPNNSFPSDLRQWLKVRVSTLYEIREEITIGVSVSKNNHVDSILQRYRIRS